MSDNQIRGMTELSSPSDDDVLYAVHDPGGTPVDRKMTLTTLGSQVLSEGTYGYAPGTLADAAAANSTIYYSSDQGTLVWKDSSGNVKTLPLDQIRNMTELTSPDNDDVLYAVHDPGGTPASRKVTVANARKLCSFANDDAPNDSLFYSTTNNYLMWKDSSGNLTPIP